MQRDAEEIVLAMVADCTIYVPRRYFFLFFVWQENYGTVSKPISPLDRPQSWVSTPKNYSPPAPEYIDPQKAQRSAQKAFLTKVYAVLSIQVRRSHLVALQPMQAPDRVSNC
eukprot:997408-Rhodomonas_salina.2